MPSALPRRALLRLAAAAPLGAVPLALQAQTWPSKAVTLVVPYAAGGPADVIARMLARKLADELGQSVVVDNRAGAGGTIGVAGVVKAVPDGHTLSVTGPGPLAGMPSLMKMPYGFDDYQHVSLVARVPSAITVNSDAGFTSLADFVAKAKAAPGKFNYGSAGGGTTPHIGAELLKQEAGIDLVHVPYKGAAPAVTALLASEIQLAMVDLTPVLQHVQSGRLRILAVASVERAPQVPQVPTTREVGLGGVLMDTNYGVVAPRGLPAPVLRRLQEAVAAAVRAPDVAEQFLKQGALALSSTPQEYARLMQSEYEKWQKVVQRGNIKLD